MQNLVPTFILDQYRQQRVSGQFTAAAMFIDISGFTKLTETLMQHQKEGAEVLSAALDNIFQPIVHNVYANGGFITLFAGDAFTALFPIRRKDAARYAAQSAFYIYRFFQDNHLIRTKFGDFETGVKIGLSFGEVKWGILGQGERHTFYFRGDAIDACAGAEHQANPGDIMADDLILPFIADDVAYEVRNNCYQLTASRLNLKPKPIQAKRIFRQDMAAFLFDEIIDFNEKGEFRDVSAIFVSFDEPKNDRVLDRFFATAIDLPASYGGYLSQIEFGDKGGVMLFVFGAPTSYENNIERACEFLLSFKSRDLGVKWRAGLTFGTVYAGIRGGKERCEYSIIGDIVNLSARFMMKAEWGQIWISSAVFQKIKDGYETKDLGQFTFKGKSRKIQAYELLRPKTARARLFKGEMVGRRRELGELNNYDRPLFDGQFAGVCYVYGEAGIGKSRLTYEFKQQLPDRAQWFHCPADQILQKSLNPFVYFLQRYFEQTADQSTEENKIRFEGKYTALVDQTKDDDVKNELIRTKSIIGAQIGLDWENSLWEQLDAKGRYENTLYALKNLIKAESRIKPVIIEIEDGHWLDSDSRALLKVLTRNIPDFPIFIISNLRYADDGSKPRFSLEDEVKTYEIDLNYLSPEDLKIFTENQLKGPISDELDQLIRDKTKGNPFFAEQMIHFALENGFIEQEGGVWQFKTTNIEIPGTINAILIARIDRLSQEIKEVVKAASVIGREFEIGLLSEVLKRDTLTHVKHAEQEQIWSQLAELQYIFKHALLRDAAYEMQLRERLKELHKLTAEAIEQLYAHSLKEKYGDLAFHYEKAGIKDKTIEYLEKAGDYAKENYKNEQALDYYERLRKILMGDKNNVELEIDVILKQAEILELIGKWDDEIELLDKGIELTKDLNDKLKECQLKEQLSRVYNKKCNYDKAIQQCEYITGILKNQQDQKSRCIYGLTFHTMGITYEKISQYDKALECFKITKSPL